MGGLLILLLMAALIDPGVTSRSFSAQNPHHPANMTWIVYNPETGEVINSSSNVAPKGTWWPILTFDLCILVADGFGHGPHQLRDFFAHGFYGYSPVIVMGRAHTIISKCLFMFAQGEEGMGTKLKNVGELISFTVLPGDVKL